jgi:deoxyadenosine/deoxycytidine kinase
MRISVDGGIGAGKTSALAALHSRGYATVPEPVAAWQELLKLMYDEPRRWSAAFNINVLLSFSESAAAGAGSTIRIYERSPLSTMHVFSVLQERLGYMTAHEMGLVRRCFGQVAWVPDVIIYLRTTPEVAFARMQQRGRNAESSVSYSYLVELHDEYERFMSTVGHLYPGVRVITIDATRDKTSVSDEILSHTASWECVHQLV